MTPDDPVPTADLSGLDAYLAVGGNLEPETHIPLAMEALAQHVGFVASSTFYRTPAIDRPEQPDYLNGVWHVRTTLTARALKFEVLRRVEATLGRVRTDDKFAARPIDLDIAIYADLVIDEPGLQIPDSDIRERPFVSTPLLELAPNLVMPDTGRLLSSEVPQHRTSGMAVAGDLTHQLKERMRTWTSTE